MDGSPRAAVFFEDKYLSLKERIRKINTTFAIVNRNKH